MRDHQKLVFTLVYRGSFVTADLLRVHGDIYVDECHSTTDGNLCYTYLHLNRRCRRIAIERAMKRIETVVSVEEIYGHRHGTAAIKEHHAYKILFEHAKTHNPAFVPSTDGIPVISRGVFLSTKKKKQPVNLHRRIAELEQELEALKKTQ